LIQNLSIIENLPILAICGCRGSAKTALIAQIVPRLIKKGLKVAVVKHDAQGINVDRPGKDSDRLYLAGADVLLQGPWQHCLRVHHGGDGDFPAVLTTLAAGYDLILVEGHKGTALPKVWLLADEETAPPSQVTRVLAVLSRDADRVAAMLELVETFLRQQCPKTPIFGCVLIGGKSSRMGSPKHLLKKNGNTWLGQTVKLIEQVTSKAIISGLGTIPPELADHTQLADVPDAQGPIAGILAAMRWAPYASWLVVACDLPKLSLDALNWLLAARRPGIWAAVPRLKNSPGLEPLLAYYDFRSGPLLQQLLAVGSFRPAAIASHPNVITPEVPAPLADAWTNINTSADANYMSSNLVPSFPRASTSD